MPFPVGAVTLLLENVTTGTTPPGQKLLGFSLQLPYTARPVAQPDTVLFWIDTGLYGRYAKTPPLPLPVQPETLLPLNTSVPTPPSPLLSVCTPSTDAVTMFPLIVVPAELFARTPATVLPT